MIFAGWKELAARVSARTTRRRAKAAHGSLGSLTPEAMTPQRMTLECIVKPASHLPHRGQNSTQIVAAWCISPRPALGSRILAAVRESSLATAAAPLLVV
jgi:hypothetical protein